MSKTLTALSYIKKLRTSANIFFLNNACTKINYSKDVASPSSDDYLLRDLKNVNSAHAILDLIAKHHKIMNQRHLLQAMKTLFFLQKHGKSNIKKEEILNHPDFIKLCSTFKTHIRKVEVSDAIEALKVFSYMGVPSDSTLMQTVLQMLRHYINDLSLQQIIFLDYVLQQLKPNPLRDAICIALPIVFEAHLSFKLDPENISLVINCFQYASRKELSEKSINYIINALQRCFENNFAINEQQAKSILWSTCNLNSDVAFEPIIQKTVPFFIRGMNNMSYGEVETTLYKMHSKYSPHFPFYYSAELCDAAANYVIDKNVNFQGALYCLQKFSKIMHVNDRLLDYVSEKCIEDPNLILKGTPQNVFMLCVSLASSDYRPVHWKILKDMIFKTECFKNYVERDKYPLIKLCASLCILEIFKRDVFESGLKMDYLQSLLNKNFQSDFENILLVTQAISTFKKDFADILPPKTFIDQVRAKQNPPPDYPLEAPLQRALGGSTYIATGVRTTLGCFIDHVIVMRKGGYPVAFTKKEGILENVEVLPEHQIVLILALRSWHYVLNCRRTRGSTSLILKILENRGYTVVPICLEEWKSLEDFEKIPYLMQTIKLKVDDFRQVSNAIY